MFNMVRFVSFVVCLPNNGMVDMFYAFDQAKKLYLQLDDIWDVWNCEELCPCSSHIILTAVNQTPSSTHY